MSHKEYFGIIPRCSSQDPLYLTYDEEGFGDFMLKQNELRFDVELKEEQRDYIIKQTAGIPMLVKSYVKAFADGDNPIINSSDNVQITLDFIFDMIPEKELNFLRQVKSGTLKDEKILHHLKKFGILDEENMIRAKLINDNLDEYTRNYKLDVSEGKLLINGNDKTSKFSKREQKFLFHILEEEFISRDDIAKIIAGSGDYLDCSEYSIDQTVSRLRKKLVSLGVDPECIKTIKKKGYRYEYDE